MQPVGNVKVIVAMPVASPETIPEVAPTGAVSALLLLQAPPVSISVSVLDAPRHIVVIPLIGSGVGLTVKEATAYADPTV